MTQYSSEGTGSDRHRDTTYHPADYHHAICLCCSRLPFRNLLMPLCTGARLPCCRVSGESLKRLSESGPYLFAWGFRCSTDWDNST